MEKPMSIYDIPLIVKQALPMAATMSNIQSGFRVSGIWTYNPDIFTDEAFLPSYITDRPQETNNLITATHDEVNQYNISELPMQSPSTSQSDHNLTSYQPKEVNNVSVTVTEVVSTIGNKPTVQSPSTSKLDDTSQTCNNFISPDQIRAFPKAGARKTNGKGQRIKRKSTILTDTPEKDKIQNEHNAREDKKNKVKPVKVCKKLKFDKQVCGVDSDDETFCLL
ncbi:unnamed protein product [Macrosiphum euphorbiae]|uniref:Uncharacterized protein n=1 Tax=Macrosiphum euphorbiae TaxID=13131 RepID=A0AAV0WA67_9HEMI|nr:unnamed protein product [Macrosiphum euphorbiae]